MYAAFVCWLVLWASNEKVYEGEASCMVMLSNWLYNEEILVDQENCEKADRFMKDNEWKIQHTWGRMNALPMWKSD